MKKKLIEGISLDRGKVRKIWMTMRLIVFLFFVSLIHVSASVYSQKTKLNIKLENATLQQVFSTIQEQTEFDFFYKNEQIPAEARISIQYQNEAIDVILDKVLSGTGLTYHVMDKDIVISINGATKREMNLQQQKSVSGKVTDSSGGSLPGVSVIVKGTTTGVITDANGNYSLSNVGANGMLQFSFVGMKMREIKIAGQSNINVVLEEETIGIEEVVAIGYGTQKKQTITGSVASVKSEKLTVTPVANTTNSLAGRLPGLISLQTNGRPGADAALLSIRGFGSALTIIDGVEANISTIDANQIESISILKDGAASIYGSRAGNGVILVTTKRGLAEKPVITINSSQTYQGITAMPHRVSSGQYTEMESEAWIQSGKPADQVPYSKETIAKYYAGNDPAYPNTNWFNELVRNWAPQQQHNLSVRGGSERIKYYGFLGYLDQGSMWKKSGGNYNRYNLQSNIDAKITDELSFQLDIASTFEERRFPQGTQDPGAGSIWEHLWSDLPIYPAHFPDTNKTPYTGPNGQTNILSNSDIIGYSNSDTQNMLGTVSLNYNFKAVKGLSAKAWINYNQTYYSDKVFVKSSKFYNYNPANDTYTLAGTLGGMTSNLNQSSSKSRNLTGQFSVDYNRSFTEKHNVHALLLYEAIDYMGDYMTAARTGFLSPAIQQLFGGSTVGMSNSGAASEMGRKSYVGRFNYNFKNKYLIETSLRADASAKFAPEKRWGYFPSISLGWVGSEEGFIQQIKNVDNIKLRASYGESGNDAVGNFQYLSGYAYGYTYVLDAGPQQGLVSTGLANPNLTWEKMKIYNIGADYSFWKKKLYGEFDIFYRTRDGIPATRITTLPSTFGSNLPAENLNSLNNRGFEFKAGTSGTWQDLKWDVSANLSWSRSKWDHFEEPAYTDSLQKKIYGQSGQWTDRVMGLKTNGLFTSQQQIDELTFDQDGNGNKTLRPGDIRAVNTNGDGKIDWKDLVEIGKGSIPHWMMGVDINMKYKNFDLSTLFQGAFGYYTWIALIRNSTEFYNGRWTEANNNANAIVPRLGGTGLTLPSDFYMKKAGYLRLKVLNAGYTLPARWLHKVNMKQVRIYVAGSNLFTFDKLKKYGTDPEAPSGLSGLYYPQQKTISFGINVSL